MPEGQFLTYGIGVSLMDMRDPALALAHMPVSWRAPAAIIAEGSRKADTRGMFIPIALAVGYVVLVVVRLLAWRRFTPPRASTIWLFFTPRFFAPAALIYGAAAVIPTRPVEGLFLAGLGLAYGALVFRMIRRIARAATAATTAEEVTNAAIEPVADFMLTTMALSLIGLIVVGMAAIVWVVATGGR